MNILTEKDFRNLRFGEQKRISGLAGLDEFYYGVDLSGLNFLCLENSAYPKRTVNAVAEHRNHIVKLMRFPTANFSN